MHARVAAVGNAVVSPIIAKQSAFCAPRRVVERGRQGKSGRRRGKEKGKGEEGESKRQGYPDRNCAENDREDTGNERYIQVPYTTLETPFSTWGTCWWHRLMLHTQRSSQSCVIPRNYFRFNYSRSCLLLHFFVFARPKSRLLHLMFVYGHPFACVVIFVSFADCCCCRHVLDYAFFSAYGHG